MKYFCMPFAVWLILIYIVQINFLFLKLSWQKIYYQDGDSEKDDQELTLDSKFCAESKHNFLYFGFFVMNPFFYWYGVSCPKRTFFFLCLAKRERYQFKYWSISLSRSSCETHFPSFWFCFFLRLYLSECRTVKKLVTSKDTSKISPNIMQ